MLPGMLEDEGATMDTITHFVRFKGFVTVFLELCDSFQGDRDCSIILVGFGEAVRYFDTIVVPIYGGDDIRGGYLAVQKNIGVLLYEMKSARL